MCQSHTIVGGNVQGVGFRNFVEHAAEMFGVFGTTENIGTDEVETFAQAPFETITHFEDTILVGPRSSRVMRSQIDFDPQPDKKFPDFHTIYPPLPERKKYHTPASVKALKRRNPSLPEITPKRIQNQYPKGDKRRSDGSNMIHWRIMRELGYICGCPMCISAGQLQLEAEEENKKWNIEKLPSE